MLWVLMRPLPGKAPGNPYRSVSLEWSMDSPPGTFNFDEIPTITEPVYNYGTKVEEESEEALEAEAITDADMSEDSNDEKATEDSESEQSE